MANALVSGYHHLTLSTDGAQDDYDFYAKTLGLYSVKRTVLFDGTIPVYHLYYGSKNGDASTIVTTFPFRKPAIYGRRGTNQSRTIMLSIPVRSADLRVHRLDQPGIKAPEGRRLRPTPRRASTRAQQNGPVAFAGCGARIRTRTTRDVEGFSKTFGTAIGEDGESERVRAGST